MPEIPTQTIKENKKDKNRLKKNVKEQQINETDEIEISVQEPTISKEENAAIIPKEYVKNVPTTSKENEENISEPPSEHLIDPKENDATIEEYVEEDIPITPKEDVEEDVPITLEEVVKKDVSITPGEDVEEDVPITPKEDVEEDVPITPKEDVEEDVPITLEEVVKKDVSITPREDVDEDVPITPKEDVPEPPLKHLIDINELEQPSTKDAENQTFLQGVPTVIIPIEQKHEVAQTMYVRDVCPPVSYSTLMISMNAMLPIFKNDCTSQTEIGIPPETPHHEAVEYLSSYTIVEKEEYPEDIFDPDRETIIYEIINSLISRTLWISDPDLYQTPVETMCQSTQTLIRYNSKTKSIVIDNETQTKLTCEPKDSNSKLLSEYQETKSFIQSCILECLKGVDTRIIIDELIEEIIMKAADKVKYPLRDQASQTVASYSAHEIEEKEMLRKLRLPVVVDPLESSAVAVSLMDDLVRLTYNEISRKARCTAKAILNSSIQNAVLIGMKRAETRKPFELKSIEEILDERRKKMVEPLKKEMETAATQTGLAGVPVVAKFKEPEDILCSVCARQSKCQWCRAAQQKDTMMDVIGSTKLLRTQDILLAYKPCFVVATVSEEAKDPHLQSTALMKKKREELITARQQISIQQITPCVAEKIGDVKTIDVLMTPKKNLQDRDSISGWTRIIDNTLAKSWSLKESTISDETDVTASNITTSISETCCKKIGPKNIPSLQETKALQILKNTFCTRETCQGKILKKDDLSDKSKDKEPVSCNVDNCKLLDHSCDQCSNPPVNKIDCQICARPRTDKVKIVPVQVLTKNRG